MNPETYQRGAAAFDFFNQPRLANSRKRAFVESAARLLPQAAQVCDVGGGTGLYSAVLLSARPDLHLTLIEPCPEMLEIARSRLPAGVQFINATFQAALHRLPPQDAFLFVRSLYALEHDAAGYQRLFADLAARLRPQGYVCIYERRRPVDIPAAERYLRGRCAELGLSAEFDRHWDAFRGQQEEFNRSLAAGRIGRLDHLRTDSILRSHGLRKLILTGSIMLYQGLPASRPVPKTDLCEYHCFSHGGQHYLFNVETSGVFQITADLARRLEGTPDTGPELSQALTSLELIRPPQAAPRTPPPPQPVGHLLLNVSQECNLACTYCYGGEGEYGHRSAMDDATARRAVDWLLANSGDLPGLRISFFGGEPLIRFDLIQKVVDYAVAKVAPAGKRLEFSITTNATLLTEERVRYLKAKGVRMHLSYDGQLQDVQRPFKNGAPTGVIVRQAVALATRHYGSDLRITATVAEPVDLAGMQNELAGMGCERAYIRQASPVFSSGRDLPPDTLGPHFMEHVDNLVEENLLRVRRREMPFDLQFRKVLGLLMNRGRLAYFCGAGRGLMAIATNGDIYPCHRFNGMPEFRMGSLDDFDPASRNPYFEASVDNIPACRACWARYLCGGGCHYDNRNNPENRLLPMESRCELFRHTVRAVIRWVAQLDPGDREFLRTRLTPPDADDAVLP